MHQFLFCAADSQQRNLMIWLSNETKNPPMYFSAYFGWRHPQWINKNSNPFAMCCPQVESWRQLTGWLCLPSYLLYPSYKLQSLRGIT